MTYSYIASLYELLRFGLWTVIVHFLVYFQEVGKLNYPLDWLDRLVTISLNPECLKMTKIDPSHLVMIVDRLRDEDEKLQLLIQSQVFVLLDDNNIRKLVRRYHSSLNILLDQMMESQENYYGSDKIVMELYDAIIKCMDGLVAFIETWFSDYLTAEDLSDKELGRNTKLQKVKQKITCMLSVDQIGIILRAADETRMVIAKSMNAVFRCIVSHLSSLKKVDLSYTAMRSRTYSIEERDKDAAILALEKMIKKIKDY